MTDSSDDSQNATAYVTLTVSPDPGFDLRFDALQATEELGRPFLIVLDVSSGTVKGNIGTLLGSSVTVTMTQQSGDKTYFNGILARATYVGLGGGVHRYHFELRPWIWLLGRTQDCKIYQNMAPWDIISGVFSNNGFSDLQDNRQNQAGSTTVEYCVQYRESSLDFVTRLMENYGIYYYFTHADGKHTMVLCDDSNSHTALSKAIPFYYEQTEVRSVEDHVWQWTSDLFLQPSKYTYTDYNFTTPSADLTAKSLGASPATAYGTFEIYDYPGFYNTASDGQKLTDIRLQALSAKTQLFDGMTNARGIRCGVKFTLSNFADTSLNQEYLVTKATTTLGITEGSSDSRGALVDTNKVQFEAIPGSTPFRLDALTVRPTIRGPQTALVVGDSGEEVTTDQYGRIKVQFYWDRVGTKDTNSSCWIRVAQSWGGAGWGAMVIPRMGMEVVVEFMEGNPDRPLVTGIVYNATQTVPYTLPDKKVITTFKSNSSKGGGGSNELRFDDTKGSEEVFLQAQYNYTKKVLNNETVEITQDTTTTVDKGNRSVTISQGDDSLTISQGKRTITVTKDDSLTVSQGNRSVTVSQGNESLTVSAGNHSINVNAGTSGVTAAQSITLTVGSNSITISTSSISLSCGPSSVQLTPSGITMSGPQFSATGDTSMSLTGGTMSLTGTPISLN